MADRRDAPAARQHGEGGKAVNGSHHTTPDQAPICVDADGAARLLGIGRQLLWAKSVEGSIPSFTVGARRLYSVAALREWAHRRAMAGLRS